MQWTEFQTYIRYLSARDLKQIQRAFEMGRKAHEGQKRRSGEPYFNHPIAVARILTTMNADADSLCAALLHDTVEDTSVTEEDIRRGFPPTVAALVDGVTSLREEDVAESPTLDERIETLRKMFTLMEQDVRIIVIKIADRLHNMQTIAFLPTKQQELFAIETRDVYVKIADRICMQELRDELEALCVDVLEPELYRELFKLEESNERRGHEIVQHMHAALASFSSKIPFRLHYAPKRFQKLTMQLQAGGSAATGIADINIVFVCDSIHTCYDVFGAIHQTWRREVLSFEDFINTPAINGYRAIHTTILMPDGTRARCKIRTEEMQAYARYGVTTACFTSTKKGLLHHLPQAESIATLSEDTADRSAAFWESLRSDILGESMVVYGAGDSAVIVPKGATALDGLLYLYGRKGLRAKDVKVDGKAVLLHEELHYACSVTASFARDIQATIQWLEYVQTGLAKAMIRSMLSATQTTEEKIRAGKELLQRAFREHKRGFLEEFDEQLFLPGLQRLGLSTLNETYIAIAEGHIEPLDVYTAIFEYQPKAPLGTRESCTIHYIVDMENMELMDRINRIHRKHRMYIQEVRYRRLKQKDNAAVLLKATLTLEERKRLEHELLANGATQVEIALRTKREIALLSTIMLLWALNPVLARKLLLLNLPIVDLLTIRFLTFATFTIGFFLAWRYWTKKRIAPPQNLAQLALLPSIGNAGISLFTYLTLLFLPPSIHLTILRFNALLIPTLTGGRSSRPSLHIFLLTLLIASGLLLWTNGPHILGGLLLSMVTLMLYTFYSLSTEHTLHTHKIDMRYPYLLLSTGIFLGLFGILLILIQGTAVLVHPLLIPTIIYVIFCVCIPHTCYSALLKTTRFKHITDLFLLEVPVAALLEVIILRTTLPFLTYLAIGCILTALLLVRRKALNPFST